MCLCVSHADLKLRYESLKKVDLENAINEHMIANKSSLENDTRFSDYFKRVSPASPKKKSTTLTETKTPRRRTIKAKEDLET